MKSKTNRMTAAGILTAILLGASWAQADSKARWIDLKVQNDTLQIVTDADAPVYHLEYRTPTGTWQKWKGGQNIDDVKSLWFRAIFENGDVMTNETPAGVDTFYSPSSPGASVANGASAITIANIAADGSVTTLLEADWLSKPSGDTLGGYPDIPEPKNNQAYATPDPGLARIYWRNRSSNRAYIWHLSDGGPLKSGQAVYDQNLDTAWVIVDTADFNGDGVTDLLWHNQSTGRAYIWFLAPDGVFVSGAAVHSENLATDWKVVAAEDMNNDGHVDIVFHHQGTGRAVVWFLTNGVYQSFVAVHNINLDPVWKIAGVADMNTNGNKDIVFHNQSTGRAVVWFLTNGVFQTNAAVHTVNLATAWKIVGVTDMNGNGHPDLVFHNNLTGRAVVWFLTNGVFQSSAAVHNVNLAPAWQIAGVKDIDNNGSPDLLFHNSSTGRAVVWFLENGAYQSYEAVHNVNLATTWGVASVEY